MAQDAAPIKPPAKVDVPELKDGEHRCLTGADGTQWVPCGCDLAADHTVAELEQHAADQADQTVDPLERVRATAELDAAWVEAVFTRERRPDALGFLRFRPHRELTDVLDAARRLGLTAATEILDGARRLAANHTGSPSPCPPGYAGIVYPVDEADVRKALDGIADKLRRTGLPGDVAHHGWSVDVDVQVDYQAEQVTATFAVAIPNQA